MSIFHHRAVTVLHVGIIMIMITTTNNNNNNNNNNDNDIIVITKTIMMIIMIIVIMMMMMMMMMIMMIIIIIYTLCTYWIIEPIHITWSGLRPLITWLWSAKPTPLTIPIRHSFYVHIRMTVMQKMQNSGSPNGPPKVDGWVVRLISG